ncbi:MAG TPA: hypothetical protein VI479_02965 [Blastocatellia bacterium]
MITAKIEAVGLMRLPYAPSHYTNALAPQSFARLLKAIEPDAREVRMNPVPDAADETHILNIRGAVAGFVPFDALYNVTYSAQPQPHVKVELMNYVIKDIYVTGQFSVRPLDTQHISLLAKGRTNTTAEKQFAVLHVEVWELRRWMILLALPLWIYLKWKVKTEVCRMGEFVARELGRPSDEGVGFRMSTSKITWALK